MMTYVRNWRELNTEDKKLLLRYPVYLLLLASVEHDAIDKREKKTAAKVIHVRSFSSDPELFSFYDAVEKDFEKLLSDIEKELPQDKDEIKHFINHRLAKLETVLEKMNPSYASVFRHSMQSFKNHVSRAHRNILEYFIFPLPINGLTD
jgi:hypothetical protein